MVPPFEADKPFTAMTNIHANLPQERRRHGKGSRNLKIGSPHLKVHTAAMGFAPFFKIKQRCDQLLPETWSRNGVWWPSGKVS